MGDLTFREIDFLMEAHRSRMDHDWSQTRLIVAALTGKRPDQIVKLSSERTEKKDWTPEEAQELIKRWQK